MNLNYSNILDVFRTRPRFSAHFNFLRILINFKTQTESDMIFDKELRTFFRKACSLPKDNLGV